MAFEAADTNRNSMPGRKKALGSGVCPFAMILGRILLKKLLNIFAF